MANSILTVDHAELTAANAPIFGFVAAPQIQAVALRLAEHWYGNTTGGYITLSKTEDPGTIKNVRKDTDPITGEIIFVKPVKDKLDKGNLLLRDAVRISEKYISMGLHPLAHAQVWYQQDSRGGPPQLIDLPDWKIIEGWAQLRRPHKTEFFQMTPKEREQNGLIEGDIGIIAYGIEDKALYGQMVVSLLDRKYDLDEARRQAAKITSSGSGIGIYAKKEHGGFRVKGRSKEWRAKRRANRDMAAQLCGDPTAAELKKYAEGIGISASTMDMEIIASTPKNLPAADQERYLKLERQTARVKAGERDGMTLEQRSNLMHGPADEDFVIQNAPKAANW